MKLRELIECWVRGREVRIQHAGGWIRGVPYRLERIPGGYYYIEVLRPGSHNKTGSLTFDLVRSDNDHLGDDILDRLVPSVFAVSDSR